MGYMTLQVILKNDVYVELTGSNAIVWATNGPPTYQGEIDKMPPELLKELLEKKIIKRT